MLWCDPSNYGGVKSKIPTRGEEDSHKNRDSGDEGEESLGASDDEEDTSAPELEMHWNLSKYLPEAGACQKNFHAVIAGMRAYMKN